MKSLAVLLVLATVAVAQDVRQIVVEVGEKREIDVDIKRGVQCDKPDLLRASMITRGDHNYFVVEGKAVGKTLCRVGTDPTSPFVVFEIVIKPAGSTRPARPADAR